MSQHLPEAEGSSSDLSPPREIKIPTGYYEAQRAVSDAVQKKDMAFIKAYIAAKPDASGYADLVYEAMKNEDLAMAKLLFATGVDAGSSISLSYHDYERNASFENGPLVHALAVWPSCDMLELFIKDKTRPEIVKLLNSKSQSGIDSFGSIDDSYVTGSTTLLNSVITKTGFLRVAELRDYQSKTMQLIRALLVAGSDPNQANDPQNASTTPLSEAVRRGLPELVTLLLEFKADVRKPYTIKDAAKSVNTLEESAQFYIARHSSLPAMAKRYEKVYQLIKEQQQPQAFLLALHPRLGKKSPTAAIATGQLFDPWVFSIIFRFASQLYSILQKTKVAKPKQGMKETPELSSSSTTATSESYSAVRFHPEKARKVQITRTVKRPRSSSPVAKRLTPSSSNPEAAEFMAENTELLQQKKELDGLREEVTSLQTENATLRPQQAPQLTELPRPPSSSSLWLYPK